MTATAAFAYRITAGCGTPLADDIVIASTLADALDNLLTSGGIDADAVRLEIDHRPLGELQSFMPQPPTVELLPTEYGRKKELLFKAIDTLDPDKVELALGLANKWWDWLTPPALLTGSYEQLGGGDAVQRFQEHIADIFAAPSLPMPATSQAVEIACAVRTYPGMTKSEIAGRLGITSLSTLVAQIGALLFLKGIYCVVLPNESAQRYYGTEAEALAAIAANASPYSAPQPVEPEAPAAEEPQPGAAIEPDEPATAPAVEEPDVAAQAEDEPAAEVARQPEVASEPPPIPETQAASDAGTGSAPMTSDALRAVVGEHPGITVPGLREIRPEWESYDLAKKLNAMKTAGQVVSVEGPEMSSRGRPLHRYYLAGAAAVFTDMVADFVQSAPVSPEAEQPIAPVPAIETEAPSPEPTAAPDDEPAARVEPEPAPEAQPVESAPAEEPQTAERPLPPGWSKRDAGVLSRALDNGEDLVAVSVRLRKDYCSVSRAAGHMALPIGAASDKQRSAADRALIEEHIRKKGVTRCPTTSVGAIVDLPAETAKVMRARNAQQNDDALAEGRRRANSKNQRRREQIEAAQRRRAGE